MKIKAVLLAVSIFGATFFVTSTSDKSDQNNETIKKQAVDRRLIKVPPAG